MEYSKMVRIVQPNSKGSAKKRTFMQKLFTVILNNPTISLAVLVFISFGSIIATNAALLQTTRHPAPLFASHPVDNQVGSIASENADLIASKISNEVDPAKRLVASIQRELTQQGIYKGVIDGLPGPRTRQAVERFEKQAGLPRTGEISIDLLMRLRRRSLRQDEKAAQPVKKSSAVALSKPKSVPMPPIQDVQTILANLGYGPVKIDGKMGNQTAKAIQRFEEHQGLPVTGKVNHMLLAKMASIGAFNQ